MIRHRVLYCGQQGQRKREAGEPELIASEVTVLHGCQRWHLAHAELKVETGLLGMALLGGLGGRDARAQTKRVTTSDAICQGQSSTPCML